MSTSIIVVEKNGTVKEQSVRGLNRDVLYKKCGYRKPDNFELRHKWNLSNFDCAAVEVWSRDSGKAGQENKYELPPPIDTPLYFGSIAVIGLDKDDNIVNLTLEEWNKIYEHLFGGFEDLADTEEESEDELKDTPKEMLTKEGYLKDNFVVDDDNSSELEEENYYYSDS